MDDVIATVRTDKQTDRQTDREKNKHKTTTVEPRHLVRAVTCCNAVSPGPINPIQILLNKAVISIFRIMATQSRLDYYITVLGITLLTRSTNLSVKRVLSIKRESPCYSTVHPSYGSLKL